MCNMFGSDTVERSRPRTEDRGCTETRPQDRAHFSVRRGVERSADGILLQDSRGEQMRKTGKPEEINVILSQVMHRDIMEG